MELTTEQYVEKYRRYISYLARKFARSGHYLLDVEELISEGMLVLTKTYNTMVEYGLRENDFDKIFRTHIYNHYIDLWRQTQTQSRTAEVIHLSVDLTEAYSHMEPSHFESVYLREKLQHAHEILTPLAYQVMRELIRPSLDVWDEVARSHVRSRHLTQCGILKRIKPLKVTPHILCRVLEIHKHDFDLALLEITQLFEGGQYESV